MKPAWTSIIWAVRTGQQSRQPGCRHLQHAAGEGIRFETLFRDETVGTLDAANGKDCVRMLRRAIDLGAFHVVIFIYHTPLVWELADTILSVRGGSVTMGDQGANVATRSLKPTQSSEKGLTADDPGSGHLLQLQGSAVHPIPHIVLVKEPRQILKQILASQ